MDTHTPARARPRYHALCTALMLTTAQQHVLGSEAYDSRGVDFIEVASERLRLRKQLSVQDFCPTESDDGARRIFGEYGAVVIAEDVELPERCTFSSNVEYRRFVAAVATRTAVIDGVPITLQTAAMESLLAAREEASRAGRRISPRGGTASGSRSFDTTTKLWKSRYQPALAHWVKVGKISTEEATEFGSWPISIQITKVLGWESRGWYFSKNFRKSIFRSVAPPGASQHNLLIAFDVAEYADREVRRILTTYGWHQTIESDAPHFTFLGVPEGELPRLGLRKIAVAGQDYWVPNIFDLGVAMAKRQVSDDVAASLPARTASPIGLYDSPDDSGGPQMICQRRGDGCDVWCN